MKTSQIHENSGTENIISRQKEKKRKKKKTHTKKHDATQRLSFNA